MMRNPIVHALLATLYITLVSLFMFYGTKMIGPGNSVVGPIAVLSLFTLSAAVMGYLFLYQPLQLYFEGKKKQAVNFFLQTVATFAAITILIFLLLFSGIIR